MTDLPISNPFDDLKAMGMAGQTPSVTPQAPVKFQGQLDDPMVDAAPYIKRSSPRLTLDQIKQDPKRMEAIRRMMSKTKDVYYEKADEDELLKDFTAHMRFLGTNELSAASELISLRAADDETRAIYGEAYKVFDDMGTVFTNGNFIGGSVDYLQAIATSPSTYLGLGIGKIAGNLGSKAAAKAATKMATDAAAKAVVTKSAGKVSETLVKQQLKNTSAKVSARWAVAGAIGLEAPVQTAADYAYQQSRMIAGVQDDYDIMQGAIATIAGGLSGIPAAVTLLRSSKSVLSDTGKLLDEGMKNRAKSAAKRAAPKLKSSLEKAQTDWLKLAEQGKGWENNVAFQQAVVDWFLDANNPESVFRILMEEGADLSLREGSFSETLIAYAQNMGDEALNDFNKALEPIGITFGEASAIFANTMRRGGQVEQKASLASRIYNDLKNVSIAKRNAATNITEGVEDVSGQVEKNRIGYAQSVWKRMLVSTFQTTAVNVKGWAMAKSSTALSDLLMMTTYYGIGGAKWFVNPASGAKYIARANALAKNQAFFFNTMLDPFLSAEAFLELLERAPKKVKRNVAGQIFGGVDEFSPKGYGLNPESRTIKTVEGISTAAQKLSFVHLQDTLTKGISGLTALDKQSRLKLGRGLTELVQSGEAWRITDEMWENAMEAVLRETFSEDLSRASPYINFLTKGIQAISSNPIGGFIIPFGKFMNNTAAFVWRHSPLAFFNVAGRVFKGGAYEGMDEALARATVGSMALYYATQKEAQKQEEGLQWFEERMENGAVENISNLFPMSVYNLLGRIFYNYGRGEGGSPDLINELMKVVGPLDALDSLASPSWIKDVVVYLSDESIPGEEKNMFFDFIKGIAPTVGDIAAGYTRPLDVYSRMLSESFDAAGGGLAVDRKQGETGERFLLGLTRYTSGFFNLAFGVENEYGTSMIGRPKESATSEGPVKMPPVVGTVTGNVIQAPARNINKLLGMVDKPPFKADSYSSGNPEYDAFVNSEITPMLELRAKELIDNGAFQKASHSLKVKLVDDMLRRTRDDLLDLLEEGRIGNGDSRLLNERRKLLVLDRNARRRAMKELGITTPERKLSRYEIEAIRRRMDLEEDLIDRTLK